MKQLLLCCLVLFCLPSLSFANFSSTDCPLLDGYFGDDGKPRDENDLDNAWSSLFDGGEWSPEAAALEIYPKENIQQALENLKGYCCQQGYKKDGFCKSVNVDAPRWAESRFLYDHLIDVGFRHLDGITKESYRYPLMADPDPQGNKRRTEIAKKALDPNGAIPLDIVNTFEEYRYDAEDGTKKPSIARIQHIDTNSNFEQAMTKYAWDNYKDFGLASKYYIACYSALFLNPAKAKNGTKKSTYEGCRRLANERINKEVTYVKVLEIEQGAHMLQKNIANYTAEYFVQNRMVNLVDKRGNLGTMFNYLARKTQGTHNCSSG